MKQCGMNSRRWICHPYIRHYNKLSKLISLAYKTYYTRYIGIAESKGKIRIIRWSGIENTYSHV